MELFGYLKWLDGVMCVYHRTFHMPGSEYFRMQDPSCIIVQVESALLLISLYVMSLKYEILITR